MGKEGIRYAAKVELDQDAGTRPYLHVSLDTLKSSMLADCWPESLAPRQYAVLDPSS